MDATEQDILPRRLIGSGAGTGISLENSGFSRLCRQAMEWLSDDTTHFHYSL
jgi:hypothetical protein